MIRTPKHGARPTGFDHVTVGADVETPAPTTGRKSRRARTVRETETHVAADHSRSCAIFTSSHDGDGIFRPVPCDCHLRDVP